MEVTELFNKLAIESIKNEVKNISGIESHKILSQYCRDLGIKMFDRLADCACQSYDVIFLFFVQNTVS